MPVNRLMPDMRVPPHPILAEGQVHAVGMPVAAVVAEDVYAAYDALDLIGVDYEPLPGLAEPEAALAPGAPLLFSGIDGNRVLTRTVREGDAAGAFAAAAHVVPLRVAQNRISAVAMEPRSVLATFDRFDRRADHVGLLPGPVPHPRRGRAAARAAGEPRARHRPRRGRRLRGEDRPLPRGRAAGLAGARARPAREVGRDAPRGPGHDQPGARLGLRGRAGAGRARAHHRAARADHRAARAPRS